MIYKRRLRLSDKVLHRGIDVFLMKMLQGRRSPSVSITAEYNG